MVPTLSCGSYMNFVMHNECACHGNSSAVKLTTGILDMKILHPLYAEGIARGGNDIHVKCGGDESNLHKVSLPKV